MPYYEIQGTKIFYECEGRGNPPLVFVHGYACNHSDWRPQVDYFRTQQYVVTCDLCGHGISDKNPERSSIESYGTDIVGILNALNLPPAILIGHSMGCRVILQAYLEAPQRIAGLILMEGSRLGTGDPIIAEQTARHMLQSVGYTTMLNRLFNEMFVEESNPALRERILSRALALPEDIGATLLPRVFAWDAGHLEEALSQIDVPLLVIQSTYINTERVRMSLQPEATTPWFELILKHVPTAQIEIITGVGHFLTLEAPKKVNHSIATFIAKTSQQ